MLVIVGISLLRTLPRTHIYTYALNELYKLYEISTFKTTEIDTEVCFFNLRFLYKHFFMYEFLVETFYSFCLNDHDIDLFFL